MRKNAINVPEASVTATLMRMPRASAFATAAWTAADAAEAVMQRTGTLC
ncbi:hypothetical protein [Sphaerotilus microaerophilus]|nr:hypothetical protein [Sphaerotilus sp. FB-5]